jgi:8-oxo-dGTP pyrophosphatase MutT (NUDIX family)
MEARLQELLAARPRQHINDPARVPSAVLIPLYRDRGRYHIIFIRRTETVKTHKGQISFPGGGRDRADKTLRETALREADEEIGLRPGDIKVLGVLDDEVTTTSNYTVTPFVALIPWPYKFIMEKAEVAEIIDVPLSTLLDKKCLVPAIETLDGGVVVDSYEYRCDGHRIWGATARILYKFLEVLKQAGLERS